MHRQLTLADIQGWGYAKLQQECFERGLLGGISKNGVYGKHLVVDLQYGLTEYIKAASGSSFLLEIQSKQHSQGRERKAGYQKKERPLDWVKQERTYTGGHNAYTSLNEPSDNVKADSKNNALRMLKGSKKKLFCDDCTREISGETAARHCTSGNHRRRKAARLLAEAKRRNGRQSSITAAFSRAGATVGKSDHQLDEMAYRFSIVAAFLKAGVPLNALNQILKPIDAGSYSLAAATHLKKDLVPIIREWELANIKRMLADADFAYFHDGATRNVE